MAGLHSWLIHEQSTLESKTHVPEASHLSTVQPWPSRSHAVPAALGWATHASEPSSHTPSRHLSFSAEQSRATAGRQAPLSQ